MNNVRELPRRKDPTGDEAAVAILRFWWWVVTRALFGPFLVMHAAGMLHLDVDRRIPSLGIVQATAATFALMTVAYFFRR